MKGNSCFQFKVPFKTSQYLVIFFPEIITLNFRDFNGNIISFRKNEIKTVKSS